MKFSSVCFLLRAKTPIKCNRVDRHVGRLSHLTTVRLMLIQTQTWRKEDYCGLLGHLSRKPFKEGFIQNIQQYLSALRKKSYPWPPPCSTLFLTSLSPLSLRRLWSRIHEGHLPISIPKHKGKAEDQDAKERAWMKQVLSGAKARSYRWHRRVCLLHDCVLNDEWFPLCQRARCHIAVNEAASYILVGVMGLAWLQLHDKKKGSAQRYKSHGNESWLKTTFLPSSILLSFSDAQICSDILDPRCSDSEDIIITFCRSLYTDICRCTLSPHSLFSSPAPACRHFVLGPHNTSQKVRRQAETCKDLGWNQYKDNFNRWCGTLENLRWVEVEVDCKVTLMTSTKEFCLRAHVTRYFVTQTR